MKKQKLTLRQYLQAHGSAIIGTNHVYKVGDTLKWISDCIIDEDIDHPFVVKRIATREEYLAQGVDGIGPYFYEVTTD